MVAVALGGSAARGTADERSDLDLGVYYRGTDPPSVADLDRAADDLDDRHRSGLVTQFGEWGPWINGGAWLVIGGRRVDWLYREVGKVRSVIDDCRTGRVTCDYQPGHPHGFHNHMYAAEVHHGVPLHDPTGELAQLTSLTEPYPGPMRTALIDRYLWEARFALDMARKPAERGDEFHVSGSAFRAVACLVQVLFALNERYFLNEKGAVAEIESFEMRPRHFGRAAATILGGSTSDVDLRPARRLELLEELIAEVEALAGR